MSRIQCRCGRKMNTKSGHEWCAACRRSGKLDTSEKLDEIEPYSAAEEVEVLVKAGRAYKAGAIARWDAVPTDCGMRYLVAGVLMDIEGLDHYVARKLRERTKVLA